MPIYEYQCPKGHTSERLRKYARRDLSVVCLRCGEPAKRIISLPHCPPDGVYSYAPNMGDARQFERRHEALKEGKNVIPRGDD